MSQATVLVVEDDSALREALCDTLQLAGHQTCWAEDGRAALDMLAAQDVGMVVSDVKMARMDGHTLLKQIRGARPDLPVLLMTAHGSIQQAVEAMRDGAVDYLVKPFEAEVLVNTVGRYLPQLDGEDGEPVAVDPLSRTVLDKALRVADSDATVMITGESGVGKEVVARYIHRHSRRNEQPFVAINCAAIPDNMLEATLFGYEKGAFTGAYQACPGKFEQAQGGTLLLDEISEMDLGLQAKLLRVLQEREVERLGGRKTIALDVRVLATSNRTLREEVTAGRFREDLFYRLNVFPLPIPALRERPADIEPLLQHRMARHAAASGRALPVLSAAALARLNAHSWPGNVRELDNVIQRAMILCTNDTIDAGDIEFEQAPVIAMPPQPVAPAAAGSEDGLDGGLRNHEQTLILDALRATNGQRRQAALRLGISERTLRYKLARMRELGIEPPDARGG